MAKFLDLEFEYNHWKNIFFRNFFTDTTSGEFLRKCFEYKNSHMPKSLFQYTKVKHAEDLLDKNLMYLRTFDELNDPFDGTFLHNPEIYQSEQKELLVDEKYKELYNVACFTEYNDNVPMWSFYGDEHKGICVEYDLHENSIFRELCFPIKYVDSTNNDLLTRKFINHKDSRHLDDLEIFLKKSQSWSYENEWRIVIPYGFPEDTINFHSKGDKKYMEFLKPKAVYLGLNAKDSYEKLEELCESNNINLYFMVKNSSGYNLESKRLI